MKAIRVSALQISSGRDVKKNLERLSKYFMKLKPSDIVLLPEVFAIRGSDDDYARSAEKLESSVVIKWCSQMAKKYHCWLVAGSVLEKDGKKIYNTTVLFDKKGRICAKYQKIHLFEAYLEDGRVIREKDVFSQGAKPLLYNIEGWNCGFSICYDLRFPELYRYYAFKGAHLFFVPANFTQRTGKAHWETLLKARAIENQAFIIAANQCGKNEATEVASYGHSIIIGPWGDVIAEADGENETTIYAELDPSTLDKIRSRIPCLKHTNAKINFYFKKG